MTLGNAIYLQQNNKQISKAVTPNQLRVTAYFYVNQSNLEKIFYQIYFQYYHRTPNPRAPPLLTF